VQVTYASAGELLDKVAAHERADLVILPLETFSPRWRKMAPPSRHHARDLGAVGIGVAVKEGAPLPDLSSEAGLKRALLEAESVTSWIPHAAPAANTSDEVVLPKLGISQ